MNLHRRHGYQGRHRRDNPRHPEPADSATDISVWITGHAPECTWPTSKYHPPCIELRVLCDVLRHHTTNLTPPT
ncbi:hypothetical protein GCM10027280_46670 [Micromonospora polyrhachis]